MRFADGSPVVGAKVAAVDRDLRSEQALGDALTDRAGAYLIHYSDTAVRDLERGRADLVVKAFNAQGSLLVASPVLFDAPEQAHVDLTISADGQLPPPLFDRITSAVTPLLGTLKVTELDESAQHQDVTFIAGEAGIDPALIARFVLAHRLKTGGIQVEFWFAVLGSALLQDDVSEDLGSRAAALTNAILALDPLAVDKQLDRSFGEREIDQTLESKRQVWLEKWRVLAGEHALGNSASPTFLGSASEHAGITDPAQKEALGRLFQEHGGFTPALLVDLEEDPSFTTEQVANLHSSFVLADVVGDDFALVGILKNELEITEPNQVATVAKQSVDEWTELIGGAVTRGEIEVPIAADPGHPSSGEVEVYAFGLERDAHKAFPTQSFGGGLERALANGGPRGLEQGETISTLLSDHPEFDLVRTPVDQFLDEEVVEGELGELTNAPEFRAELKTLQRVFKLAPAFEAADAILADGLDSAHAIYRLGESEFVRRYDREPGFTGDSAQVVYQRAAETHAAVLTIVGDLQALQSGQLPAALQNANGSLAAFPNWENLFQAGDLCDCDHCRSVIGPAAYFADILMFIKDRKAAGGKKAKDILFHRRPDLGYLELNCENANVPLPYIDLVCEVLEKAVDTAGANKIELGTTAQASATTLNSGGDFTLVQIDSTRWVVHGNEATYLLKKQGAKFYGEVLPNTKADAQELRAYPAYVNPYAYEELKQWRFPWRLPFDLFAEEVRAGFDKAKLQRWELMRTFRGPQQVIPTDGEIAAEYFGISCGSGAFDEHRLIVDLPTTDADRKAAWGETGTGWISSVANVKVFLGKTGLEYEELQALLDLAFVNPDGAVTIQHLDSSCDTSKKTLGGLDAAVLDRIHRFVRLWRKLPDWAMWELDLVVRHPAIGNGTLNDSFLFNLFVFCRLRERLGSAATVERVCGLFGNLNTQTRFVKAHEPRAVGLYQQLFLNKKAAQPLDTSFEVDVVTKATPTETISGHKSVVLGALGIGEPDLNALSTLTAASQVPFVGKLTLANLSLLWRHAWLAKSLKLGIAEWETLLKLVGHNVGTFATPEDALKFVERVDDVKRSGFTLDQLDWILSANGSAKAAVKESDASRFLATLRTDLQAIQAEFSGTLPTDEEALAALLLALLQQLHRDEPAARLFIQTLRGSAVMERTVPSMATSFTFSTPVETDIPAVSYDGPSKTLKFVGVMSQSELTTLLAELPSNAQYQGAIQDFFEQPRLVLKFLDPFFTAALPTLPPAVDFDALEDSKLAARVAYDSQQRLLQVRGILTQEEKDALLVLSADADYSAAVNSLYAQPSTGMFDAEQVWLEDADLVAPLQAHASANLATAITKARAYLARTLSENLVIRQTSAELGLDELLTQQLLTAYPITLPDVLTYLIDAGPDGEFAPTTGVVDYPTLGGAFKSWFWMSRVALLWKAWTPTLAEVESVEGITNVGELLDLASLPHDPTAAIASLDRLLRADRLMRLRDRLPESDASLLGVLATLAQGGYATVQDFAADVERVNGAWSKSEVAALVGELDLAYPSVVSQPTPHSYFLTENWERIEQAFGFTAALNAGVTTVATFAEMAMTTVHAKALKDLLRSKLGVAAWLSLSQDIQDVLRERKRDALAAYLLAQPKPTDAPSGKWENTNDLYAYYLLDVEMSSCQLTSRLVQASGSVQLFVQRCFMGLEPNVTVDADGADGDSAWRWWAWMRKYRVWEANRKVFLWPENWIAPELKQDRSPFFKDLENELMQNDINDFTVETAFANYLEKLNDVAQLEIAGFYQEDDAGESIVHVFGRTKGVEPHVYYYRRFDYRQWTPWEKVDLEIQGDYLAPAVVGGRLYLFWPIFTEVPDDAANSVVSTPSANQTNVKPQKAKKRLRLQLAVSDFRQGKWTPKRVSTKYVSSTSYTAEIIHKRYVFMPIDRSSIDGRFAVVFDGHSVDDKDKGFAYLQGAFAIDGCHGVPEPADFPFPYEPSLRPEESSTGDTVYQRWEELRFRLTPPSDSPVVFIPANQGEDFTLATRTAPPRPAKLQRVLDATPGLFEMTPAWQLAHADILSISKMPGHGDLFGSGVVWAVDAIQRAPLGTGLPFFYNDDKRTFFVLPTVVNLGWWLNEDNYSIDINWEFTNTEEAYAHKEFEVFTAQHATVQPSPSSIRVRRSAQDDVIAHMAPPEPMQADLAVRAHASAPVRSYLGDLAMAMYTRQAYEFRNFYHPLVCDFAKLVENPLQGIPGLMKRETQLRDTGFSFKNIYKPTDAVVDNERYPREVVDFSPAGAYSSYNWELFFHAPLLIANALSKNQRFDEARDWYHSIFNPIGVDSIAPGGSAMSKYWITKPFFETGGAQYVQQRIENLLKMLSGDSAVPGYSAAAKNALNDQVRDWRTHPFDPHRIASYRTVAYQKTVVMRYLDNLIEWGDYLFRQDSMESINEASQLYVLAAELLGPPPKKMPPRTKPPVESFNELEQHLDDFSNAMVQVENLVPPQTGSTVTATGGAPLPTLYFCTPRNDNMLRYWDTVRDRLFKIRHCMNIEGVVRQLALFEAPIDPGALVKAVAGGAGIGAAMGELNAPLPLYRFNVLLQKANEVCNDVKALGGALLSALEKKDAEALSLLRQTHEIRVLESVTAVREQQLDEAKENLEGARQSKVVTEERRNYYRDIEKLSSEEHLHLDKLGEAHKLSEAAQLVRLTASILSLLPALDMGASGFGGSPLVKVKWGGLEMGQAAGIAAEILSFKAAIASDESTMASSKATFNRRWDDWKLQERLADKELVQLDHQIAAAELRVALAEKELENHLLQIENAKSVDAFMRSKYTNAELYQWQAGQISGVYFQSYKLAYDLAKRAERCARFELGLQDSSVISFGYWDGLKKGLLAGEKLQLDLRRLDNMYLDRNRREFELTKHVSLALLEPLSLLQLRETGSCTFKLPEEIFDLDYPGHYFRRIKSVSLSLPAVTGPYTTVSCTLRLLRNSIRINTDGSGYARDDEGDDLRFVENNIPVKAIAASSGQNDSGVFELSFRDERYLPFEGAGVISTWKLELTDPTLRQFDYDSIADAVLHVKYTAREDAGPFRTGAVTHLKGYLKQTKDTPLFAMLNLRKDFPAEWSRFVTLAAGAKTFEIAMSSDLFPARDADAVLKIDSISILTRCAAAPTYQLSGAAAQTLSLAVEATSKYGDLILSKIDVSTGTVVIPSATPAKWKVTMTQSATPAPEVEDVYLVLGYRRQ